MGHSPRRSVLRSPVRALRSSTRPLAHVLLASHVGRIRKYRGRIGRGSSHASVPGHPDPRGDFPTARSVVCLVRQNLYWMDRRGRTAYRALAGRQIALA